MASTLQLYVAVQGATVVAVTSGANINFDRLRLVSELADIGALREAMLATTIPEQPGSFLRFIQTALDRCRTCRSPNSSTGAQEGPRLKTRVLGWLRSLWLGLNLPANVANATRSAHAVPVCAGVCAH